MVGRSEGRGGASTGAAGGASTSAAAATPSGLLGAKETSEQRVRRLRDEDMLIARAKAIREKIKVLDARANVKTHDEGRRKSHWEYVLTEMTWLARDFASERDWKQETSRQVAHLAAACEGAPIDREQAEVNRQKARCAAMAAEVAKFWGEAWERAKEKPLPNAGDLVDVEEDEDDEDEADDENEKGEDDGKDKKVEGETENVKSLKTVGGVNPLVSPMVKLAATPPPLPGLKIINAWASNKLYLAMVEMKRDLVRDAIELKQANEQKEREKEAKKKGTKKQKTAKPTRGRGAKKDEAEEEDELEEGEDTPIKSDRELRIAAAEEIEMDGMDMDMGLLAPPTPPEIEEFMPILYDAVPALNERAYRETMQIEAHKFAEYEHSLRAWEENERKRARALVEAARHQAEEDAQREIIEKRLAFLAAAAARGNYFDEEGYMVDIKGRRKKNKRGEFIQFGVPAHEAEMDFGVPIPKRTPAPAAPAPPPPAPAAEVEKQPRGRTRVEKKKRKAGTLRPWTPMEDQLLCAIVHEFGSNWALITDTFAVSSPIKGMYHPIDQCRWRFSHLTQKAEQEHDQNAIAALNLNKGSARMLMARALPVEDETVRIHYDRACAVMNKHMKIRKAAKMERLGMDKSRRTAPHRSWRDVQAICGPVLKPLELAEQAFIMQVPNGAVPAGGVPITVQNMSQPVQRLATMQPMGGILPGGTRPGMPMSASGVLQRVASGGMPMSMPGGIPTSSGKGVKMAAGLGKKRDGKTLTHLQQIGSYSPAPGGAAMQLAGIGGTMPGAGSKSPALAPGSYALGRGVTTATKRTTTMKKRPTPKTRKK